MRRFLLALLVATAARGQPLGLRTQGPLRELFLDVTAFDAHPLTAPSLDLRWSMANTWNEAMVLERGSAYARQELDEQADSLSVLYRHPWHPKIWTGVEARATLHWGGFSDQPIEAWHHLIGSFNFERENHPRNAVRLLFADDGGTAFDLRSATWGVSDLAIRTQATVLEDGALALAGRFDLKLPVGSLAHATGSGGFDAALGALASWRFGGAFALHGLFALSRFSPLSVPTRLQPKPWHFTFEASFEATFFGWTGLVEDRVLSPLLSPSWRMVDLGGGDDAVLSSGLYAGFRSHNQVSFGLRRGEWSAWLSEDFTPGDNGHAQFRWLWESNAPDIVIGLAWTHAL